MILGGGGMGVGVCHQSGLRVGVVLATKAGWGRWAHVFFRKARFRVVSGLVVRRAWWLGLLII